MIDIVAWGAITFGFAAAINIIFFLVALLFKTDKFTDFAGSLSFFTLAVVGLTWVSDYFPRQIVLSSLVIVWSLRLGSYLVARVVKRGKDDRFDEMRKVWWKWALFWGTQITWVWVVFLPVMFIQATHVNKSLNACDYVGWSLWFIGLMIETVADLHRMRFNNDKSENRPKFLSTGLWKYSRHPNYLGETLLWFGIWLSSSNGLWGIETAYAILGLFSPAITFVLLVFISGIPPAEKRDDERFKELPEYYEYKKQTSPYFFFPTSWYRNMPMILRKVPFCDLRDYTKLNEPSVENGNTTNDALVQEGSKQEGKIWRDSEQIHSMLPLLHYLFSIVVCAPLVIKYGMKKEIGYETALELLALAAAFNVVAVLKSFRKESCNLKSILNGIVGLVFGAVFYHITAIIFGAHYLNNYERTFAWATWMSTMTTFPLGIIFGFDPKLWFASIVQRQHDGSSQMSRLVCDVYSLWFGSWAGCIVIPLDWDRPWQAWPIPNVVGSMVLALTTSLGYIIKDVLKGGVKSLGKASGVRAPAKANAQGKAKASPAPKSKASPAPKTKASPAPKAKATPAPAAQALRSPSKSPLKRRAAPKTKATAPTRSRSISRSPSKKEAVPSTNVPSTPKASRSKSKVATPRTSTRLRK